MPWSADKETVIQQFCAAYEYPVPTITLYSNGSIFFRLFGDVPNIQHLFDLLGPDTVWSQKSDRTAHGYMLTASVEDEGTDAGGSVAAFAPVAPVNAPLRDTAPAAGLLQHQVRTSHLVWTVCSSLALLVVGSLIAYCFLVVTGAIVRHSEL